MRTMVMVAAGLFSTLVLGAEFHVAPTGDDAAAGAAERPWRTLAKAAEAAMPGDRVVVHGGTYRETLRPRRSGEAGKPIRFEAAPGQRVVISGADPLQASGEPTREGAALRFATKQKFVQLFVDGQIMPEACFPNRAPGELLTYPRAEAGKGTGYEAVVDEKLPRADLTGAIVQIWNGEQWWCATRRVAASTPGRELRFDKTFVPDKPDEYHGFDPYQPKAGNYYVVFGHAALADAPGEWFLDESAGSLLVVPPDDKPLASRIEVKTRELAIDLMDRAHIQIGGFEVFGAAALLKDATHCIVEDCRFRYIEHFREFPAPWQTPQLTLVTGSDNEIRRCGFAYSAASALRLRGTRNRLVDSIIHDVNYMGTPQGGILADKSEDAVIDSCTITRTGRDGIMHGGSRRISITRNDISSVCMLNADSGAIYCWGTDGTGSVIAYNRVHDNTGKAVVGIYLDNFSKNFTVHHNLSWNNTGAGITLNSDAEGHLVANNTLSNNGSTFSTYTYVGRTPTQKGTRIVNNLVTGRLATDDPRQFVQGELAPAFEANGPGAIDADGVPLAGSAAIDAGVVVQGITEGFAGAAPDQGAIEVGRPAFRSGASWTWPGMPAIAHSSLAWAPLPPITEETMIRRGLIAWLDASRPETVEREGERVIAWKDRSGGGRDAVASGKPPITFVERGIGARPAIRGGGTSLMKLSGMPDDLTQVTVVLLASAPSEPGRPWQRLASAWTGEDKDWVRPNWTFMRPDAEKPAPFGPTVFATAFREKVTLRNFAVFGSLATNQGFEGLIGEVLLYDRPLSDEEQTALEAYLKKKWVD